MDKCISILLIDDDQVSNYITKRMLVKFNVAGHIEVALNGLEGLKSLVNFCPERNLAPDIIFLDVEMPVLNGFDFLEEYKKLEFVNKDEVKIIVMSSTINPRYEEKFKSYGVHCYIQKPLSEEKVAELLGSAMKV